MGFGGLSMLATAIYFDGRNSYQTDFSGGSEEKIIGDFNAYLTANAALWGKLFLTKSGDELSSFNQASNNDSEPDDITPEQEAEYKQYLASQPILRPCACCGKNQVNVSAGEDTCSSCIQ